MKNLTLGYEKFTIITLNNAGRGRAGWGQGGAGRGGSKKSKPILAPPHGAGLKSYRIPAPPPLRGGKIPCGVKRGGAG